MDDPAVDRARVRLRDGAAVWDMMRRYSRGTSEWAGGWDGRSRVLTVIRCQGGSAPGVDRYSGVLPSYAEVSGIFFARGWLCLLAINHQSRLMVATVHQEKARIQSTSTANLT